jgi:phospholipid transport system transporter-binding protein
MTEGSFMTRSDGTFAIQGELTFSTVPDLLGQSKKWLAAGHEAVTINLENVAKADSAGLALMIEWLHLARTADREIHFVNIPVQLNDLIRLNGLKNTFPA